jgi:hypothetical protein
VHIQLECQDEAGAERIALKALTFAGTGLASGNTVFWFPEIKISKAKVLQIMGGDPGLLAVKYKNLPPLGESAYSFDDVKSVSQEEFG